MKEALSDGISTGIATTYGVEDLFATDNGTEQTEITALVCKLTSIPLAQL